MKWFNNPETLEDLKKQYKKLAFQNHPDRGGKTKEELKALSFRWSSNKSAWYFHRDGYKKRSKKSLTLDEIRGYYGSEKIEKEGSGKIAVA